jgi:hypothetical protein
MKFFMLLLLVSCSTKFLNVVHSDNSIATDFYEEFETAIVKNCGEMILEAKCDRVNVGKIKCDIGYDTNNFEKLKECTRDIRNNMYAKYPQDIQMTFYSKEQSDAASFIITWLPYIGPAVLLPIFIGI